MVRYHLDLRPGRIPIISRIAFVLLIITFLFNVLSGQHASGLYDDNYAGIHGVIVNPSSGSQGLLKWDVNLASGHLFFHQNYAFLRQSNVFHALKNQSSIEVVNIYDEDAFPEGTLILDFDDTDRTKSVSLIADVMGPSAFLQMDPWAFGVFTRLRAESGVPEVDGQLGYYQFQSRPFNTPFAISRLHGAAMVWGEIGMNISKKLSETDPLSVGVSLKYLLGYEGFRANSDGPLGLLRKNRDNLDLIQPNIELAATTGLLDQNSFSFNKKGSGIGLDLGVSGENGKIKWGVSILDLGIVTFNNESELHRLTLSDSLGLFIPDFTSQQTVQGIIDESNELIAQNTLVGNSFSIFLPARLRLHVDRHIWGPWFFSATYSQPLLDSGNSIVHKSYASFSPRFETRWATIHLPVVIDHFRSARVGFAARLGFLIIGSDDLMSLMGKSRLNGTSVYAAIKINPFNLGRGVANNGSAVGCPNLHH